MAAGMKPRELKRLEKELADIAGAGGGVTAELADGDLTHWKGYMEGPDATPYAGGHFVIDIVIPSEYPYSPPKMKFDSKIWHPNISSQTGAICLDILGKEWSPALTIRTALLSIQALLSAPEPSDPQDAEVAEMYKTNRELFNQTAKHWTDSFARAPTDNDSKVKNLMEMGFPEDKVRAALVKANWDETTAVNALFEG
mmetsp:Transcript_48567/g.110411  ORF Transcript_48567/g.110411 Transcript_48567/m.110411 type:complete len:198 (+) Transcript_48567:59-652(+)|eukprot:CAMPEP_0204325684 /NCGR_PEP_ID=MMETSP0469-20131031/11215_1 /ASSEMBLY_ACC=CAM_ASM_000384 /TAXON_ID=2969 /ORGANISM="Oxyrrhis marina" /LENGTH=197 /DNA_ID=CAMNT_0051307585 /DNA_START=38 /DNA_END=631 /DNA_ORIENTATION=-